MRFPVPTPNFALRSTRGAENGKSANGKCSTVGGSVERTGESKIVTDPQRVSRHAAYTGNKDLGASLLYHFATVVWIRFKRIRFPYYDCLIHLYVLFNGVLMLYTFCFTVYPPIFCRWRRQRRANAKPLRRELLATNDPPLLPIRLSSLFTLARLV